MMPVRQSTFSLTVARVFAVADLATILGVGAVIVAIVTDEEYAVD
jgi:hypothetical protein